MNESIERIYSQIYKNMHALRRNTFRLSDVLIWPMIFLFTLTFFATYLGTDTVYLNMIILGMMGWRVIYFLNLEIVSTFVEEYWSKSLAFLLISPISRLEFALGSAASGLIKGAFVVLTYIIFTNIMYGFVVPDWGTFALAMFFMALIGFSMGLVTLGIGYYWKEEAFNIAFIWPDVIVLLSGVYFTVESVYPPEALPLIYAIPSTHAFNLLKSMVGVAQADVPLLALLTAFWLAAAYLFNGFMYEKARRAGKLTRLG